VTVTEKGSAEFVDPIGGRLQRQAVTGGQRGQLQGYALTMLLGILILLVLVFAV
jgi:hypothetical protein